MSSGNCRICNSTLAEFQFGGLCRVCAEQRENGTTDWSKRFKEKMAELENPIKSGYLRQSIETANGGRLQPYREGGIVPPSPGRSCVKNELQYRIEVDTKKLDKYIRDQNLPF